MAAILQKLFVHILVQFLFTTSETELDYYQQKANVRVASEFREVQKNPWNAWIWWRVLHRPPESQILTYFGKKSQNVSSKTFHRKTYFAYKNIMNQQK